MIVDEHDICSYQANKDVFHLPCLHDWILVSPIGYPCKAPEIMRNESREEEHVEQLKANTGKIDMAERNPLRDSSALQHTSMQKRGLTSRATVVLHPWRLLSQTCPHQAASANVFSKAKMTLCIHATTSPLKDQTDNIDNDLMRTENIQSFRPLVEVAYLRSTPSIALASR